VDRGRAALVGLGAGVVEELLDEALDLLDQHYVDPDSLDPLTLERGAVRGMTGSLDDRGFLTSSLPDIALLAGQPLAVGFDVLFIEPDRFSPEELARQLPGLPPATLARVPDPDRQLAAALAAGPTVLALSGAPVAQAAARLPARGTPLATAAGGDSGALPLFPAALVSRPELEAAAAGQGLINAPPDLAGGEDERGEHGMSHDGGG